MCVQDLRIAESTESIGATGSVVGGPLNPFKVDTARIRLTVAIINPQEYNAGVGQDAAICVMAGPRADNIVLGVVNTSQPSITIRKEDVGDDLCKDVWFVLSGTYAPLWVATSVRLVKSLSVIEKGG